MNNRSVDEQRLLPPWPVYTEEEIQAVASVLRSNKVNYWTGEQGKLFEKEFATYVSCSYAVALANGTVALDLAMRILGISAGDEVIVTSRTFIASVSSIINASAYPVFVDVDSSSQNITAESVRASISNKTKAILCVHLAGWPCEMDEICALAEEHSLLVIEDCAQAHGARYKDRSVGGFGHVAAWSFCQDKIMSTGGEGGMLTTNDKLLWERAWSYKDHGKSWEEAVNRTNHPPGFRWLHESFGTNWRMTEMQAAIGRIQCGRMGGWHRKRAENARMILDMCENYPLLLRVPRPPKFIEHAWYRCYVFVNSDGLRQGWNRDRIIAEINKEGIPCFSGSCSEVYLEKAFEKEEFRPVKRLQVARELGETSLMFLVHPSLAVDDMKRTCGVIDQVMKLASI